MFQLTIINSIHLSVNSVTCVIWAIIAWVHQNLFWCSPALETQRSQQMTAAPFCCAVVCWQSQRTHLLFAECGISHEVCGTLRSSYYPRMAETVHPVRGKPGFIDLFVVLLCCVCNLARSPTGQLSQWCWGPRVFSAVKMLNAESEEYVGPKGWKHMWGNLWMDSTQPW